MLDEDVQDLRSCVPMERTDVGGDSANVLWTLASRELADGNLKNSAKNRVALAKCYWIRKKGLCTNQVVTCTERAIKEHHFSPAGFIPSDSTRVQPMDKDFGIMDGNIW